MTAPGFSNTVLETKTRGERAAGQQSEKNWGTVLTAVVANRFDRATFFGFLAAGFLFGRFGLLINEGVTAIFIAFEIIGSGLPAEIAINALIINVIFAGHIFRVSVCYICHIIFQFCLAILRALLGKASAFERCEYCEQLVNNLCQEMLS